MEHFQVGTVVVTQAGQDLMGRLLSWTQGSRWTHVFIVTGSDTMVEARPWSGVKERPLAPFMAELEQEGRAWVALDTPSLSDAERAALAAHAHQLVGRLYDYLQAVLWFLTHGFWSDGELRLICSRLITACYQAAVPGTAFFPESRLRQLNAKRAADLRAGYCTPLTILELSSLQVVATSPGAIVPR